MRRSLAALLATFAFAAGTVVMTARNHHEPTKAGQGPLSSANPSATPARWTPPVRYR